ncbi:DMT family transporter [Thermoproteus tenax]|uniref:Permease of the drug/metabolite transporter superfamily n=1 Tax=Thermoproteus tenax (strain ATCC 35583 / DSM 2078 / JCM 9277 / NBRC 100435 / Kra 1) TaxID=768679 RepID=G4RLH0_THETK|nr:DMT family transporter [Thermoproteus tenax]CCC82415.1 permease of the drug/metabolite transporter superfamily [Thermoproteus tenax Kra 1]
MNKKAEGILEMVVTTAIWGSVSILSIYSGLPSPVFVFFRVFFTALSLLLLLRNVKVQLLRDRLIAASGVFLALNWIFLFYSVAMLPVSIAVMIYYTGPVFSMFVMHFIGEKLSRVKLLSAAISFAGLSVIINPFVTMGSEGAGASLGLILAILSGVSYGLLIVFNKLSVGRLANPLELVLCQTLISTAITFPFLLILHFELNAYSIAIVLVSALVNTLLALFLWYDALRKISVHTASILSYLDPVFATLFAYIFLGQVPAKTTMLGGALIIIGGVMAILEEVAKAKKGA